MADQAGLDASGGIVTNTYRSLSEVGDHYFGKGVSQQDLTVEEERDALIGGHLELVPRKYKVLSDNYTAGEQGAVVELALLKEIEAALVQGGHIERVPEPADSGKKDSADAKTAPKKKED